MGQPAMIGAEEIAALRRRDGLDEARPGVGKHHRGPVLVEPVDLALGQEEDAAQDQSLDPLGVGDGVGQGQGRTPGAAEQ